MRRLSVAGSLGLRYWVAVVSRCCGEGACWQSLVCLLFLTSAVGRHVDVDYLRVEMSLLIDSLGTFSPAAMYKRELRTKSWALGRPS